MRRVSFEALEERVVDPDASFTPTEDQAIENVDHTQFLATLDFLPEIHRRILILFSEGCPDTEIAATIGKDEKMTRALRQQAMERYSDILQALGGYDSTIPDHIMLPPFPPLNLESIAEVK